MGYYGISDVVATALLSKACRGRCFSAVAPYRRDDGSIWWDGAAEAIAEGTLPPGAWSSGEKQLVRTAVAIGSGAASFGIEEWGIVADVVNALRGPK